MSAENNLSQPGGGQNRGPAGTAGKVLLLDGHSLAFRAFYALPDTLVTSSGQLTNAVYGFTAMLIKLIADEKPQGVVVCFDKGAPRFRVDRYADYKGNRAETPDPFRQQLPLIREVLDALRISMVELEGYEADDLLATLASRAREKGNEVVVVTGDRDCLQLVCDGVAVMMTRRGISDVIRYDRAAVIERYGVPPEKWTDFVALKGEPSDNLPGVPGIGDKTAAQLIAKYGDIEEVIAHADELTPKLRAAVKEHAAQVRINKELGRLLVDVPVELDVAGIHLEPWDDEEVRKLFTSLEFRTLYDRLSELKKPAPAAPSTLTVTAVSELRSEEDVPAGDPVALSWDENWLALCANPGQARFVPIARAAERLRLFLADDGRRKVAHDAKPLYRLALASGINIRGFYFDAKIAAYLLEPGAAAGYTLADTVRRYLSVALEEAPPSTPGEQASLDFTPRDANRVGREAQAIRDAVPVLEEQLRKHEVWELATAIEFPLIDVLARMEHAGILVDRAYLKQLDEDFGQKLAALEREVQDHAGEPLNVNSPPQLQKILFEKLKLPKTRKIKTGYSTDASELVKLSGAHPIIDALIKYREVAKLKTGFTDMLLTLIDPATGRIHTTYEQTRAATGRLASTAPNLQNIPIRGELGRQIRRAFVAPPGHLLLSADYSQIELRVLAHLSGDEAFLQAFAQKHDFHATIAAKVYGVPLPEVTPEMRGHVKQFSYGIAYGMSAYGVSQRLSVERDEAEQFIEAYYAQFPKLREFLESQVKQAKIDGFTKTMFGRRRYLPELQSSNFRLRSIGERMALNAPIQGSAADIIKKAMIDVAAALAEETVATMLLTVHDELVFEVAENDLERARKIIEERMVGAVELRCGLAVDIHTGSNWAEAHA
jgi:DNA polymerase-1